MKRLLLELGGKGAAIVFDDADLKAAIGDVISTVWGFHSGQICTSPTRVIVPARRVRPARRRAAAGMAGHLKVGDPLEQDTVRRPGHHRRRTASGSRACIRAGHRPRAPPSPRAASAPSIDTGFYVAPTLRGRRHQPDDHRPRGGVRPGVVVIPFDDEDEAIAIANDSPTTASTATCSPRTPARPWTVAKLLRSGNVGINTLQRNHEAPFGGFKYSPASAATAAPGACTPTPRCSRSCGRAEDR